MTLPRPLALFLLPLIAACTPQGTNSRDVPYHPEESGTVAHALCLLGFTGIPLTKLSTGHQMVQAKLNGQDANFVVDTGANATVLNAGEAAAFGIDPDQPAGSAAMGLSVPGNARQVSIDSLKLGPVDIRADRMVAADLSHLTGPLGSFTGEEISGIIGQDVLTEHRAVIDVPGHVLYLIEPDRDPAPVPSSHCSDAKQPA